MLDSNVNAFTIHIIYSIYIGTYIFIIMVIQLQRVSINLNIDFGENNVT